MFLSSSLLVYTLLSLCLISHTSGVTSHTSGVTSYSSDLGVISHHRSWKSTELEEFAEYIHFGLCWKYYHTDDGINWQLNFNEILSSPLLDQVTQLVEIDRSKVQFQNATGRILRRGDDVRVNRFCRDQSQSGSVVLLVLFTPEDRNDYGELLFFDDVMSDVTKTLRPSDFSVIKFSCRQPYQWQYPAIQTQKGLVFIQFLFIEEGWVDSETQLDNTQKPFPTTSGPYTKLGENDLTVKVTSSFNLTADKPVYILDNLFEERDLSELAEHFLLSSRYIYQEHDDSGYTDNVVFITPLPPFQLVRTRVWAVLERVLVELTGREGWYPYDVSNNLNEPWDHTRIHPDCFERDEYTLLVYLNKEYQPGDLGGTVWYDTENGENILGSVMNKFGRLAVFQCSIPHSARPPHAYKPGPRLTFAVKVAEGRGNAVVRSMSETSVNKDGDEEKSEEDLENELWEKLHDELGGDVDKLEAQFEESVSEWIHEQGELFDNILQSAGSPDDNRQVVRDEL